MRHVRPVPVPGHAPKAVRIHTLGQFRVLADGSALHLHSKASKPLQLLKVLIALGAESVAIDQLTDSLWPQADGDRAYGAFTITLRRLRELVGHQGLILRAGRLSLNPHRCWVDAIEFGTKAAEAARALRAGDEPLAYATFHEALECYRGPFLPGEFEPTEKLSARAQLHGMFLRSVESFGGHRELQGRWDEAAAIYQQALEVDDQSESLYQRLMRCLLMLDRAAECGAVYRRCRELLQATAGVAPSAETEAIHAAALQRQSARVGPAPLPTAGLPPPDATGAGAVSALGERRMATVACLHFQLPDALNSPQRAAERDRLLWTLNAEALASAARHGGSISPHPSGAYLAWFGYPAAHDDDPRRAARAVVDLRDRLQGAQPTSGSGPQALLTAGIATGYLELEPGGMGPERLPTGSPVAVACGLAAAAQPGQVLADSPTWSVIREYFSGAPVSSPIAEPGAPPACHAVLRPVNITSRFEASLRRGLSAFVGRGWELDTLGIALEAARQGQGQVVTLVGEAGIGKTRMVHEFRRVVDRNQFWVVEGRCQAESAATPYAPWVEVIRRGTLIEDIADPVAEHDLAVERMCASAPELKRHLPQLLHLLSIPSTRYPLPDASQGTARRHALEDAVAALFAATSAVRPLVVILEDWHWADDASDAVLYHLLRQVHGLHMLVIVTHRPEYKPQWGELDPHRALRLGPLDSKATAQLLRSVAGTDALPAEVEALVHARTQGNALFVEEMALALLAQSTLAGGAQEDPGAPEPSVSLLPATVDAVIRARIDRLAPLEREVLRLAAVIGPTVDIAVLEQVSPQPGQVRLGLHHLSAQGLLHPVRLSGAEHYEFKHVLTQEVAYATLLPAQRRALHGRVGAAIEHCHGHGQAKHIEAMAGHFERSDEPRRAAGYLELAGDMAQGRQAQKAARTFYQRALDLQSGPVKEGEDPATAVDLAVKLASVSEYAPSKRLLDALRAARATAKALDDQHRLAQILYWMGRIRYLRGDLPAAAAHYTEAMRIAQGINADALSGRCLGALGRTCLHTAEHERGIGFLALGISVMEELGEAGEVAYNTSMLGLHYAMLGDFDRALRHGQQGLALVTGKRLSSRQPMSQLHYAWVQAVRGNFAAAQGTLEGAANLAHHAGDTYTHGLATIVDGWLKFMTAHSPDGIPLMEEGIQRIQVAGFNAAITQWHGLIAEVYALTGELEKARSHAQLAIVLGGGGQRHGECIAHRALAIVAGWERDPDREDHAMGASLNLAERLKERPYAALSHLRFAELLLKRGEARRAQKHGAYARSELEAMGMTGWLPLLPC